MFKHRRLIGSAAAAAGATGGGGRNPQTLCEAVMAHMGQGAQRLRGPVAADVARAANSTFPELGWCDWEAEDGHHRKIVHAERLHPPTAYAQCNVCLLTRTSPLEIPRFAFRNNPVGADDIDEVAERWEKAFQLRRLKQQLNDEKSVIDVESNTREFIAWMQYREVIFDLVRPTVIRLANEHLAKPADHPDAQRIHEFVRLCQDFQVAFGHRIKTVADHGAKRRQNEPLPMYCWEHGRVGHHLPVLGARGYMSCWVCPTSMDSSMLLVNPASSDRLDEVTYSRMVKQADARKTEVDEVRAARASAAAAPAPNAAAATAESDYEDDDEDGEEME